MIFEKVKGFFGRFWQFLFNRKEFWTGVKKESFGDSLRYCFPLLAVGITLLSLAAGLSVGLAFGWAIGIIAAISYPLLLAVIFVISFGLYHLAFKVFGGTGKFYETLQVAMYYLLYNSLLSILFISGLLVSIVLVKIASLAIALFFIVFIVFIVLFIFAFVSILEGFSTFHKISKFRVFAAWVLLAILLNILITMIFLSFSGLSVQNFQSFNNKIKQGDFYVSNENLTAENNGAEIPSQLALAIDSNSFDSCNEFSGHTIRGESIVELDELLCVSYYVAVNDSLETCDQRFDYNVMKQWCKVSAERWQYRIAQCDEFNPACYKYGKLMENEDYYFSNTKLKRSGGVTFILPADLDEQTKLKVGLAKLLLQKFYLTEANVVFANEVDCTNENLRMKSMNGYPIIVGNNAKLNAHECDGFFEDINSPVKMGENLLSNNKDMGWSRWMMIQQDDSLSFSNGIDEFLLKLSDRRWWSWSYG